MTAASLVSSSPPRLVPSSGAPPRPPVALPLPTTSPVAVVGLLLGALAFLILGVVGLFGAAGPACLC